MVKLSKCGETYIEFFKLYEEYDSFISNCDSPWTSELWSSADNSRDTEVSHRRVVRWAFSSKFPNLEKFQI